MEAGSAACKDVVSLVSHETPTSSPMGHRLLEFQSIVLNYPAVDRRAVRFDDQPT
jgi:hypothetical protein